MLAGCKCTLPRADTGRPAYRPSASVLLRATVLGLASGAPASIEERPLASAPPAVAVPRLRAAAAPASRGLTPPSLAAALLNMSSPLSARATTERRSASRLCSSSCAARAASCCISLPAPGPPSAASRRSRGRYCGARGQAMTHNEHAVSGTSPTPPHARGRPIGPEVATCARCTPRLPLPALRPLAPDQSCVARPASPKPILPTCAGSGSTSAPSSPSSSRALSGRPWCATTRSSTPPSLAGPAALRSASTASCTVLPSPPSRRAREKASSVARKASSRRSTTVRAYACGRRRAQERRVVGCGAQRHGGSRGARPAASGGHAAGALARRPHATWRRLAAAELGEQPEGTCHCSGHAPVARPRARAPGPAAAQRRRPAPRRPRAAPRAARPPGWPPRRRRGSRPRVAPLARPPPPRRRPRPRPPGQRRRWPPRTRPPPRRSARPRRRPAARPGRWAGGRAPRRARPPTGAAPARASLGSSPAAPLPGQAAVEEQGRGEGRLRRVWRPCSLLRRRAAWSLTRHRHGSLTRSGPRGPLPPPPNPG